MKRTRPEAAQGKRVILTSRFCCLAWSSVRPHQAISGSVKTTAGMATLSKAAGSPARASTETLASRLALWASIGSPAV